MPCLYIKIAEIADKTPTCFRAGMNMQEDGIMGIKYVRIKTLL